MEFCERCGKMLVPERHDDKIVLVCRSCGFVKGLEDSSSYRMTYSVKENKRRKIVIITEAEIRRRSREEQELMEDYYKLFLETYAQSESESESEG